MSNHKPMVQRTRRLAGQMLTFLLQAEDDTLREFAATASNGRAAKTLVKEGALRVTLVALRRGTVLPAHRLAAARSVQTIRGRVLLGPESEQMELPVGALVAFGPGAARKATALSDAALLITVAMP